MQSDVAMNTIFRNYDIRGEFGTELTPEVAYTVAHAYVEFAHPKQVVIGADVRLSSPVLKEAVVRALLERGIDVIDIGVVSTDVMYFATWFYKYNGGIMVTASHMPKQFNGLKFLRMNDAGMLVPIGRGLGMEELESLAHTKDIVQISDKSGAKTEKNIWDDFVSFTHSFVDVSQLRRLKVVMDPGNGTGGIVAEKIFKGLPLDIIKLHFEPDGNFPNHPANPIIPENRRDIIEKVKATDADLGVAWDADCDRVYFIDERGQFVDGDFITTLLALQTLEETPRASIVYDVRFSHVLRDWVTKKGGAAIMSRVGHTYIKHLMRETGAVFAGEVSGHYYFARNAYMENGFAPALIIMETMSKTGKTLSELVASLGPYHVSGEINFEVADAHKLMEAITETYEKQGGTITHLDGVSIDFDDWRCNLRPSANDPVVRLNMEAKTEFLLHKKLSEVTLLIGGKQV